MKAEDYIKMRDRAASAMLEVVSIVSVDHTPKCTDRDAALFWEAVHQTAVRELACIPHPDELCTRQDGMLLLACDKLTAYLADEKAPTKLIAEALGLVKLALKGGDA